MIRSLRLVLRVVSSRPALVTYSKGNKIKIAAFCLFVCFLVLGMEPWPHVYWASAVH